MEYARFIIKVIFYIDQDAENWCLTRSQATPSSLNKVQDTNPGGFVVLQSVSAAGLILIVTLIKLLF